MTFFSLLCCSARGFFGFLFLAGAAGKRIAEWMVNLDVFFCFQIREFNYSYICCGLWVWRYSDDKCTSYFRTHFRLHLIKIPFTRYRTISDGMAFFVLVFVLSFNFCAKFYHRSFFRDALLFDAGGYTKSVPGNGVSVFTCIFLNFHLRHGAFDAKLV